MSDVATTYTSTVQSGATATGNGTLFNCGGLALVGVQVSGTFVGTITFEATGNDSDWQSVGATNVTSLVTSSTTTGTGLFVIPVSGFSQLRARISAWVSGQITVKFKGLQGATSNVGQTSCLPGSPAAQTTTRTAIAAADGAAVNGSSISVGGKTLYAEFDYSTTGTPATVSVRCAIEGSADGTNWHQLVRFPDQTGTTSGARVVRLGTSATGYEAAIAASALATASPVGTFSDSVLPPRLRAVTMLQALTGGTTPTVTVNVRIVTQ